MDFYGNQRPSTTRYDGPVMIENYNPNQDGPLDFSVKKPETDEENEFGSIPVSGGRVFTEADSLPFVKSGGVWPMTRSSDCDLDPWSDRSYVPQSYRTKAESVVDIGPDDVENQSKRGSKRKPKVLRPHELTKQLIEEPIHRPESPDSVLEGIQTMVPIRIDPLYGHPSAFGSSWASGLDVNQLMLARQASRFYPTAYLNGTLSHRSHFPFHLSAIGRDSLSGSGATTPVRGLSPVRNSRRTPEGISPSGIVHEPRKPHRSRHGVSSPKREKAPTRNGLSSHKIDMSPTRNGLSSHKIDTSPTRNGLSSHKLDTSPTCGLSSHKMDSSPTCNGLSSHKMDSSPTRKGLSSHKMDSSPTRNGLSSHKMDSSPTRNGLSSHKMDSSPTRKGLSSHKMDSSPTRYDLPFSDEDMSVTQDGPSPPNKKSEDCQSSQDVAQTSPNNERITSSHQNDQSSQEKPKDEPASTDRKDPQDTSRSCALQDLLTVRTDQFSPDSYSFSPDGIGSDLSQMSLSPVADSSSGSLFSKRRKGNPVPASEKNEAYVLKRMKNNVAAKKSREKRREHEQMLTKKAQELVAANQELKVVNSTLVARARDYLAEIAILKQKLIEEQMLKMQAEKILKDLRTLTKDCRRCSDFYFG